MTQRYIQHHPAKYTYPRRVFENLTELDSALDKEMKYGGANIYSFDLSRVDFSGPKGAEVLSKINEYDDQTKWPDNLKEKMAAQLEKGKNPGLGIRALHAQGFTGKNVNVAIIDDPLFVEHPEYGSRIVFYKEEGFKEGDSEHAWYHGNAVSSLLVGKNCGTAPDANLYFWAHLNWEWEGCIKRISGKIQCDILKQIIDFNNAHDEKDKIRCLSCSWGSPEDIAFNERQALFGEVEKSGCMVIGGFYSWSQGYHAGRLKRDLSRDTDNPSSYQSCESGWSHLLLIPCDNRTYASQTGGYTYGNVGGMSWTCPYIAGVVACALQADPDFTRQKEWQEKMWRALWHTAYPIPGDKNSSRIIQPRMLVDHILEMKKERRNLQTQIVQTLMQSRDKT